MRLVLIGDGESPHLLKWARALKPHVDLWVLSSRAFLPGFAGLLDDERLCALETRPRFEGGNGSLLLQLPRVVAWLRPLRPDWLHAHYLTSHGTLAMLAQRLGVRGRLCGSAWGSDILVTPGRNAGFARLTRKVLQACALTTSDSVHMAERMRALGAGEVMVFPFGLEVAPPPLQEKEDALFFANRGLESLYAPQRVLNTFAGVAEQWPAARLVVANDGSLRTELEVLAAHRGLAGRVRFTGRLDHAAQAEWYGRARWYLSMPQSDSVSVSLLEAMGQGCIPIVSDLPANRELVQHARNGWVAADGQLPTAADLESLLPRRDEISQANRDWVMTHAMFGDAVERFVARLYAFENR